MESNLFYSSPTTLNVKLIQNNSAKQTTIEKKKKKPSQKYPEYCLTKYLNTVPGKLTHKINYHHFMDWWR